MEKQEIYQEFPNLEYLKFADLLLMEKELKRFPEDKKMLEAVKRLTNILSTDFVLKGI